jgi:DNA-binding LacI/PurR family transcriptional regulator
MPGVAHAPHGKTARDRARYREPVFWSILQGIEDAAHREGHPVLVGDTQQDEKREGSRFIASETSSRG